MSFAQGNVQLAPQHVLENGPFCMKVDLFDFLYETNL